MRADQLKAGDKIRWGEVVAVNVDTATNYVTVWFRWNGVPLSFYASETTGGVLRANCDCSQEVAGAEWSGMWTRRKVVKLARRLGLLRQSFVGSYTVAADAAATEANWRCHRAETQREKRFWDRVELVIRRA